MERARDSNICQAGHREFFARLPPAFAVMLTAIDRTGYGNQGKLGQIRDLSMKLDP